jgi:hypothetical protein
MEWPLRVDFFQSVIQFFGVQPVVDAFATASNTKLPRFWSRFLDPHAEAVNAFDRSWNPTAVGGWLYLNPPFSLLPRVIAKIIQDRAKALLVVPEWFSAPWWYISNDRDDRASTLRSTAVNISDGTDGYKPTLASSGASSRRRIVQLEELVTDLLHAAAAAPAMTASSFTHTSVSLRPHLSSHENFSSYASSIREGTLYYYILAFRSWWRFLNDQHVHVFSPTISSSGLVLRYLHTRAFGPSVSRPRHLLSLCVAAIRFVYKMFSSPVVINLEDEAIDRVIKGLKIRATLRPATTTTSFDVSILFQ